MPPANTGTKSVDRTWKSVVVDADPDFERDKRNEVEYEFEGKGRKRVFTANRANRHPFNVED
jgi:hypothetical protein